MYSKLNIIPFVLYVKIKELIVKPKLNALKKYIITIIGVPIIEIPNNQIKITIKIFDDKVFFKTLI